MDGRPAAGLGVVTVEVGIVFYGSDTEDYCVVEGVGGGQSIGR